ncbi:MULTISPECIES: hypothetical protein [unclassified Acinetobacter]|uniref:hypothetical protein n=3 Tax=Acinetobacter TaxID=469 RepID=UPI0018A8F3D4|nr:MULTISPECIES: hypothetical protein [unclassified Acinetobacter]MBJ9954019.1 hypothetical protein [Acinetobacter baumannii]
MKSKNIFLLTLIGCLLSGCNTIGMLADTKEEFKHGNYIFGTFMGLSSITFGPVIDVFTLGGLLNSEQAVDVWSGAATLYATQQVGEQSSNQTKLNTQMQAKQNMIQVAQKQSTNISTGGQFTPMGPDANKYNFKIENSVTKKSSTNNMMVDITDSGQSKTSRPVNCLREIAQKDGSLDLVNACSKSVSIAFCYNEASQNANVSDYLCHAQKSHWSLSGIDYKTQSPGTIEPGNKMNIGWAAKRGKVSYSWIGCSAPFIIPIMSTPTTGYCRDPNIP